MRTNHSKIACEETYHEVEAMINMLVLRHLNKHGGDKEELDGDARLAFMVAYCTYELDISSFTTWVWIKVWYKLMDGKRKISRRAAKNRIPISLDEAEIDPVSRSSARKPIDWDVLASQLGADGKAMLRLVLEAPGELRESLGNLRRARGTLRKYMGRLGWTTAEITSGYTEVREAMGWSPDAEEFVVEPERQLQFVSYGPRGREW